MMTVAMVLGFSLISATVSEEEVQYNASANGRTVIGNCQSAHKIKGGRLMEKSLSNQAARPTSEVRRNPDGLGVDRVDVQQVEAMPRDGEVPALTSLAGIWKDDPHFDLRALRSEWE